MIKFVESTESPVRYKMLKDWDPKPGDTFINAGPHYICVLVLPNRTVVVVSSSAPYLRDIDSFHERYRPAKFSLTEGVE